MLDRAHAPPTAAARGPPGYDAERLRNVFFIEDDYWPLNTVLYVRDFHGNDPRFVFYLLRQFDLGRFATGAGVPTLNRDFVHGELVAVPPLAEQQRIVGILDEAFEGIAAARADAERNLRNARALFESRLEQIYSRTHGWSECRLGDLAAIRYGYTESASSEPLGPKFLRITDIRDNGVDWTTVPFCPIPDGERPKYGQVRGSV